MMSISREEKEVYIDLYNDRLDAIYDELQEYSDKINSVKIEVDKGKSGFASAKKIITKYFKEANVLWDVANYMEDQVNQMKNEIENKSLDEYNEEEAEEEE
jgi:hypothetical protein